MPLEPECSDSVGEVGSSGKVADASLRHRRNCAPCIARHIAQHCRIDRDSGLLTQFQAIAEELREFSIDVNAVAPGFIATPMTEVLSQQVKDAMLARIPLNRMGSDAEVAAAIVFLASEEAGYITGHVLDINGGMYMG